MLQSLYLDVFIEAALYTCLFPISSEPTFFAMHSFGLLLGEFNMAVACATIGASLGQAFNYALGHLLKRAYLQQKNRKYISKAQYDRAKKKFTSYGAVLIFFSWMPMFNFTVFASGFLGMRAKLALPVIIIGQTTRYGWFLFH